MNHPSLTLLFPMTVALAMVGGCAGPQARPLRTVQVSNSAYHLDELFTDPRGYTVYRFYDSGDWRYYVVGPNGAQMLPTTRTVTETVTQTETIYVERDHHNHGGKR